MIYALANQKGGVGKTTSTVNIAACLAEAGHRVLLVDADPQANATSGVLGGDRPSPDAPTTADVLLDGARVPAVVISTVVPGLDLVPSGPDLAGAAVELVSRPARDALLRTALAEVSNAYPYVFIDCPPSLDLVTINALVASTRLIVPVQCEYYALEGLSRLMETVGEVRSLYLMWRFDLPRPELQRTLVLRNGRSARLDFLWEESRHCGEFDGMVKLGRLNPFGDGDVRALVQEKQREDAVRDRRWGMSRWGWIDLGPARRAATARMILEGLAQSRRLYVPLSTS